MASEDLLLHLSRAAGLGAYLVLWLDMCFGVALTGWFRVPFAPRWRVADLHQFTGTLGLGLLGMHVAVLVGLQQQPFSIPDMLVPFARQINPIPPLLGISAVYVMLLVVAISRARRRVGARIWRAVHLLSFAGFALSLVHARLAGPDSTAGWLRAMYVGTVVILACLTIGRVVRVANRQRVSEPATQRWQADRLPSVRDGR